MVKFMQEENKGDKIRRVLQLYAKLSDGYVINKAEEAAYYGVTERSITRDIDDIRNSEFFDQAKISFEFHGERIEISIEGKEFRVLKGDSETDIVKSIKEEIDNEGSHELYVYMETVEETEDKGT